VRKPLAHVTQPRTELRAEHRQVWFDPKLRRLDLSELDVLHPQLVGDLVDMARNAAGGAGHDEPP